ncbi:MAG: hypothetical protein LGR52_00085 [Candidatus Thiosymbion ectosymbiont of Robbea hypermnestra]|nr:hypothetical protein [Candidatus Thiosymbion ectosymbiont of Robbea hypermnestra]
MVGSGLRTGWLILGITLLLILICEAGLRLALAVRDRLMDRPVTEQGIRARKIDRLARTEAYRGVEWAHEYFTELQSVRPFVWRPYVYWRHPPHRSRYVNLNRDGLRATWNPPPRETAGDNPPPVRLFTFGASTMWGYGARDDHTIASSLSKRLHTRGYRAQVTNRGQPGYVDTQAVVALLRCLHRGEIPDIALFFGGANEVVASRKHAEAGVSVNEWQRRLEFDLLDRPQSLLRAFGQRLLAEHFRGFNRFLAGLKRRHRSPTDRLPVDPPNDGLAHRILGVYAINLAFVESLGRRYGFASLFYWQPTLFSKRRRSPGEQAVAARLSATEKTFDEIYRRARQSAALHSRPGFREISGLFDGLDGPHYLDMWHLSEPGNRLIAAAMAADVIALIEQHRAGGE